MNMMEIIKTRRSVRTFDGNPLKSEDKNKLCAYMEDIPNPYEIPVKFTLLDAKEHGLSSVVIKGEPCYLAASVQKQPHSEEAYGFSFEKLVLYAWSLGIGTTWIGGTLDRKLFEREAGIREGEAMYCVSPLGYPAGKMSVKETVMRKGVRADKRLPAKELFFDHDFSAPLITDDKKIEDALEMVRLAPSATNSQPWRIVRDKNAFHFYLKHNKGYATGAWDMQKIDMGIALCHFMTGMGGGRLVLDDPKIPVRENTEYIATVVDPLI